MDLLLDIERYLKGELPYKTGVDLYERLGNNSVLKALFQKEDGYSRKRLKAELQSILDQRKLHQTAVKDSIKSTEKALAGGNPTTIRRKLNEMYVTAGVKGYESYSPSKKKGKIDVEKLPGYLKTEYYKQISYIREISATNAKLQLMPSDEERCRAAHRIVELAAKRRAILSRLDYFTEHGHDRELPAAPQADHAVTERVSWHQAQYEIKLLRSQRSRLKNNPARRSDYESVCTRISELEKMIADGKAI